MQTIEWHELEADDRYESRRRWANELVGPGSEFVSAQVAALSLITPIHGARILSLGCGSTDPDIAENVRHRTGYWYEPVLERKLHALGAHIIGVDAGRSDESFDFRNADLLIDALPVEPGEVDIAYSVRLYGSPELNRRAFHAQGEDYPSILHTRLIDQLHTIMPQGTYVHDLTEARTDIDRQMSGARGSVRHTDYCDRCGTRGYIRRALATVRSISDRKR